MPSSVPETSGAECDDEMTMGDAIGDQTSADMDIGFIGSIEPEGVDDIADMLLAQLGAQGRRYKRESRRSFKNLVSEI